MLYLSENLKFLGSLEKVISIYLAQSKLFLLGRINFVFLFKLLTDIFMKIRYEYFISAGSVTFSSTGHMNILKLVRIL